MDKDKDKTPEEQIKEIKELVPKETVLTEEESEQKYETEQTEEFFKDEQEDDIIEVNFD